MLRIPGGCLLVALAACSGKQDRVTPPPEGCADLRGDPPPEVTLTDPPVPESRLAIQVTAPADRIRREVAARVPVEMGRSGGQSIGIAGRLSYRVTRGDFEIDVAEDRLVATVPISVAVEVCKPLGPVCITYGRCQPGLQARAGVPLTLSPKYEIGRSQVEVSMTRGCVIAGFDATSRVHQIAVDQARDAAARIDAAVPPLLPHVRDAWQHVQRPLPIDPTACARIIPEVVLQGHPSLAQGVVSTRLAVTGRVRIERPCRETETDLPIDPPAPRPPSDVPHTTVMRVPITLPWAEVASGFGASRARGTQVDGKPRVALEMSLDGCHGIWVVGEPYWDAATKRVRLRAAKSPAFDASRGVALPKVAGEMTRQIEQAFVPGVDARLAEPEVTRVVAGPDGVVVLIEVHGAVQVDAFAVR